MSVRYVNEVAHVSNFVYFLILFTFLLSVLYFMSV